MTVEVPQYSDPGRLHDQWANIELARSIDSLGGDRMHPEHVETKQNDL
jgi:hypothetical protein